MSTRKTKVKIKKPITNDEEILEENEKKSLILLGLGILLVIVVIIGIIVYLNFNKVEKDNDKPGKDNDIEVVEPKDDTVIKEEDNYNYYTNPVTIVSKPTVTKYTVEYYNGDELLTTSEVESGKNISKYNLTLEGMQKLKYWYYLVDGNEVIFDFNSDTVTSDLKLYAKIVNQYFIEIKDPSAVTEDENLYELVAEENETLASLLESLSDEQKSELFIREKSEGVFEKLTGFYTDKESEEESMFDENTKINKDYILYAKYENLYEVTFYYEELPSYEEYVCRFEDNGELEANCGKEFVVEGQKATEITDLISEGKTIKEWYLYDLEEKTKTLYDFDTPIDGNIVLVPVYGYVLTYETNGGSEIDSIVLLPGESLVEPDKEPTKPGYAFDGWYNGEEEINFELSTPMPESDLTISAKWTAAITFDSKGGNEVEAEIPEEGKITKPSDPTRGGYTFAGWYYDEEYTQAVDFDKDEFTAPDVLYAKWVEEYSITFDPNGGEYQNETTADVVIQTINQVITIPDLKDEYVGDGIIAGYSTTEDGEVEYEPGDIYEATGDTTLYVVWEESTPQ